MRNDMQKVLVERGRVAHYQAWTTTRDLNMRRNAYRKAKNFQLDEFGDVCDEFSGKKLPMRSRQLGYKLKMFNENLRPLWRFLHARVGRPWNDVYSEIMAQLDRKSTVQNHVLQHLEWDVIKHTVRAADGRVWEWGPHHGPCDHDGSFYVEPETGRLCIGTVKRK
ncbi:hypothetical protein [Limnohabitans sp.]